MLTVRTSGLFERIDDDERARFLEQARARVVPVVRERALADVGAALDPHGTALVVLEVLEQETWGRRHTWLMAGPHPWDFLTELVVREVRAGYRASAPTKRDRHVLRGIREASEGGTGTEGE